MKILFPQWVLPFALAGAVALYAVIRFEGADRFYRLWYYTPAALVVGSLVADRFKNRPSGILLVLMDLIVAAICVSRPLFGWPSASGHGIFFVYAFLTASGNTTRIFAVLLAVVTLYAKIWLWHWDKTLWPGLVLGLLAGCLYRRLERVDEKAFDRKDANRTDQTPRLSPQRRMWRRSQKRKP